ncbi:MAG: class I SAM-dependent methyltransferase, partial [Chlamydiae bacterium]|nr:class I SAM-dependent methyltransferase [Chlamydiota bacterium]
LDLGSGLGQVDIYLAKKHSARIIGVDCASYMVEQANKRLAKESSIIQDRVSFLVLQQSPTLQEFPNESFDLVFSKEVFYHLPAKEKFLYLQEIYRVLKPGGKVLIADWGQRGPSLTMQQAIRTENSCFLLHPEEFSQLLAQAHFQDVQVRDVTDQHLVYTREDLQRIDQNKYLLTKLDAYAYDHALTSCSLWLKALEEGSLLAEVFSATKPQQEK